MPDVAVHTSFGREVLAFLPEEVRETIIPEPYTFALFGPDVWFMYQPWHRREGRGRQMHTTKPGAFLSALLRRAAVSAFPREMFSYLAGFLCHYALDSITHPYIIWITTEEHVFPRGHQSLEHALDYAVIERDGFLNEPHPVTKHYFPRIRLPECLKQDLDAVFESVYGWKNAWADMNRSCRRYRQCYRVMEHPRGTAAHVTRLTRANVLKSLVYSESHFHYLDPENTKHRLWHHPYDPSFSSTDSFQELRDRARDQAVQFITAAWRFLFRSEGTEEAFAALVGNNSYLSGLPADDPRNHRVKSLLPSGTQKEEVP
jgi:hypothetical protein